MRPACPAAERQSLIHPDPTASRSTLIQTKLHGERPVWSQNSLPAQTRKTGPPGIRTLPEKWVFQGGPSCLSCSRRIHHGAPSCCIVSRKPAQPGRASPKTCRRGTARASRIPDHPTQVNLQKMPSPSQSRAFHFGPVLHIKSNQVFALDSPEAHPAI